MADFGKIFPENSYARKNIGYLYAMRNGSEWILETDDDTYPLERIDDYLCLNVEAPVLTADVGYVNSFAPYFPNDHVWPRGFPLQYLNEKPRVEASVKRTCPLRQFMIAGNSDFDAIYRLTGKSLNIDSSHRQQYLVDDAAYAPVNTQATLWHRSVFPLLYLPSTTTMRVCDILKGYVAQRCLKAKGWSIGIAPALFFQERNAHDYFQDFKGEVPLYLYTRDIVEGLKALTLTGDLCQDLRLCYTYLCDTFENKGLIHKEELTLLNKWLTLCHE